MGVCYCGGGESQVAGGCQCVGGAFWVQALARCEAVAVGCLRAYYDEVGNSVKCGSCVPGDYLNIDNTCVVIPVCASNQVLALGSNG